MSHLSKIVNREASAVLTEEGFDVRSLAPKIWANLDEHTKQFCGCADLRRRLNDAARRIANKAFEEKVSKQPKLPFEVEGSVVVGEDQQNVKMIEALTEAEFDAAVEAKEKNHTSFGHSVSNWKEARDQAKRFWKKHPDWLFGDCLDAMFDERKGKRK